MNKKEMDAMESQLRDKLMKERWQKTAEQELKYAIKIPIEDGGWLYVTETKEDGRRDIKTYNTYAEAQRDNTLVWNNKGEVVKHREKEPTPELPYASNKEIADEKIGKWLSAALEDPTTCGAMKDDINEWFQAIEEERLRRIPCKKDSVVERKKTGNIFIDASNLVDKLTDEEIEELRVKKQAIKEELYDVVKMEMFKASSALEGIEYDNQEVPCKTHPDAPHGFDRNASHSLGRYVCECEYWEPDWEPEELEVEGWNIEKPQELKQLLESIIERMNRIEHGDD